MDYNSPIDSINRSFQIYLLYVCTILIIHRLIQDSESDLNITETCLELENGTEVCTSNDETKPHLTLNSHIISG